MTRWSCRGGWTEEMWVRFLFVMTLVMVALVAAACGGDDGPQPLADTEEVVNQLREIYIDQDSLTDEELNRAAIQGILDYLDDPYTSYLNPQRFEEFTASLSGEGGTFEGIGAEVAVRDDHIMIVGPLPNSPAIRAGIKPGDIILAVDGESLEGFDLLAAVDLIRGPKDSTVVLTILRAGALQPMDLSVVRDTIELTSILARIQEDGVGYIRLSTFDEVAVAGLIAGLAELRAEGMRGLILDLRNNSGGLVDAAVGVTSEFVPEGLVCTGCNPGADEDFRRVTGDGSAFDLPLVVLVNAFSASASEIVAGALQDHDRAIVIGTTTFGKGSVNILAPLESGSGLYVTTSRWGTPDGRLIEGEGIEPDITVGTPLDVQAAQRVGAASRSLCDTFDEERTGLAGQDALIEAIDGLCNLDVSIDDSGLEDDVLGTGVVELRKLMN
jgi:carboxyl-terminal processing protease